MRNLRNILVVSPELYRKSRMLAAEHHTTVTAIVAYFPNRTPYYLKASRFRGPKSARSVTPPPPLSQQMGFSPVCQ
jgi:hypothetical protein